LFLEKSSYDHPYQPSQQPEKARPVDPVTPSPATHDDKKFIEEVYTALLNIYGRSKYRSRAQALGLSPHDLAAFAIKRVITHTDEYLDKSPQHVANARAENAFNDLCRRQRADRGEGARGTRVVDNDYPVNPNDPDSDSFIEQIPDPNDPLDEWMCREYYSQMLEKLRKLIADDVAWRGFLMTEIDGLTQAEAARQLGVSRETLNRLLRKAREIAMKYREELGWEGYW
jgi:RNA polymerase sigma factor (sigma-70 family)